MPLSPLHLLDTNTVSALMADHPKIKARLSQQPTVVTSAVVLGEVRYGLERLPAGKRRSDLESKANQVFAAMPIEPVTPTAGDLYGRIRRQLEMQGLSLSDNDLWIAATALSLGAILVSNDQAFTNVPGLTAEDWTV
jgi:tRNA(fMet)-specific endonuclease VapC